MTTAVIAGGSLLVLIGIILLSAEIAAGAFFAACGLVLATFGAIFAPVPHHPSSAEEANSVCAKHEGVASTDVPGDVFTCRDGRSFEFKY